LDVKVDGCCSLLDDDDDDVVDDDVDDVVEVVEKSGENDCVMEEWRGEGEKAVTCDDS